MAKLEIKLRQIKKIYTTISKLGINPTFKFPEGGKATNTLKSFVSQFERRCCGDSWSPVRMVDYCIFQLHKNRNSEYANINVLGSFGMTAITKYKSMSTKEKTYAEDKWLEEIGTSRQALRSLIKSDNRQHPHYKYVKMPSEESTKLRYHNTPMGMVLCDYSTLLWDPFSHACQTCEYVEDCKLKTSEYYPELYRLRQEEWEAEKTQMS